MIAAQAILDRGYGKPMQSIDASITESDTVRFYAEVPRWLQRPGNGSVAIQWQTPNCVGDEEQHLAE